MRGFRFILAGGFTTALLCAGQAVSTQPAPGEAQRTTAYDRLTPGELYQQLFGESVTEAKRFLAAPATGSAVHTLRRIRTDPFGPMIPAQQVANSQVAQRPLANSQSSRPKPRRARPALRKSSRPKSISQRTRMVGKVARTRSTTRLNNNKARAKQRIKRTSVPARRRAHIARRRPPLIQANKTPRAPARKTSTNRSPATPNRKKPNARKK